MADNSTLIEAVRYWIACDDQHKALQRQAKDARNTKKAATEALAKEMDARDVGTVNLGTDGRIIRKERRTRAPLTKKYVTECLAQLFEHDAAQQEHVTNHIMDNRPITVKEDMQMKRPPTNNP